MFEIFGGDLPVAITTVKVGIENVRVTGRTKVRHDEKDQMMLYLTAEWSASSSYGEMLTYPADDTKCIGGREAHHLMSAKDGF